MSKIVFISASLRANSNSELLAQRAAQGARDAGHDVEFISLKGKTVKYCIGCLACQKTRKCVQNDDVPAIAAAVKDADSVVFVTPIYYYEMSGQLKTLLDRLNPLYGSDYAFRRIYLISVAADDADSTPERAVNGLGGWIECFEKASFGGQLFCGGLDGAGEAAKSGDYCEKAYAFGKALK